MFVIVFELLVRFCRLIVHVVIRSTQLRTTSNMLTTDPVSPPFSRTVQSMSQSRPERSL